MIRRFSTLLNRRSFITAKDTDKLKEEFRKLSEHHNASAYQLNEPNAEIKLNEYTKITDELRNKF